MSDKHHISQTLNTSVHEATARAQGFCSTTTLNITEYEQLAAKGYAFCIREINPEAASKTTDYSSALQHSEAVGIMKSPSFGGLGLALMPLYSPSKTEITAPNAGKEAAKQAIQLIMAIGLPVGVTVWLNMSSINDNNQNKTCEGFLKDWTEIITKQFTAGRYYGDTSPCDHLGNNGGRCDSNILQSIDCGTDLRPGGYVNIEMGDNSEACKIRWAHHWPVNA